MPVNFIIKSYDEIQEMKNKLLREKNDFLIKDTSEKSKGISHEELTKWISQLENSKDCVMPPSDSEVFLWLTGKSYSALDDYD